MKVDGVIDVSGMTPLFAGDSDCNQLIVSFPLGAILASGSLVTIVSVSASLVIIVRISGSFVTTVLASDSFVTMVSFGTLRDMTVLSPPSACFLLSTSGFT